MADIELVLFGRIKYKLESPVKFNYLGTINDESLLPSLYSAADITVVPSEYETFGQIVAESMACETPVVAFNNSGPKEIIDHKINGYLANYLSADDLASGIYWSLKEANLNELKHNARKKIIDCFSEDVIAKKYYTLYNSVLNK
jgi:glycosyltransferase involved in cell wall biosynthesis